VGNRVKIALNSRITHVDLVHALTEDLARRARFTRSAALDLALAVREAFINAVKHGNGMDESKKVEVEFERNEAWFRVRVRDEGRGFDWNHTADPRAEENLDRTCGRGIFFMKNFVDEVSFHRRPGKGTEVLLEKRIEPAARGQQEAGRSQ
jgi:serine/threonine-protein kinase RsbW